MNPYERSQFLIELDNELFGGGIAPSEWCIFLVGEADTTFVASADLATIIVSMAAVETYLRAEYKPSRRKRLADLVGDADLEEDLKFELQALRQYRNSWVHVACPDEDQDLVAYPEKAYLELEEWSKRAVRALRRVIYMNQFV